jgi:cysteine desulfurase
VKRSPAERIYLDYAATTPLSEQSKLAMQSVEEAGAFNPSSPHAEGRRARALLEDARDRVASVLGASRKEIEFTASGSEADNHALRGVARALGRKGHIVTSAVEHHAVLRTVEDLADDGFAVTYLPVDRHGRVDPATFEAALRDDTLMASIMYANNEIGTVQPIADLAAAARRHGVLFHTDAIQAPGWLPLDVGALGVDLLSISAHKFYGPKGVGVLFVRDGTPLHPLVRGGGQEFGRRAGTENVAGIVGLAAALEIAAREREASAARVGALRDELEAVILASVPGAWINASGAERLPHLASVGFPGAESQALLARLDLEGVAVSAGSACTSGVLEPSHVLAALEPRAPERGGVIRFSLGRPTSAAEVRRTLEILGEIVPRTGI